MTKTALLSFSFSKLQAATGAQRQFALGGSGHRAARFSRESSEDCRDDCRGPQFGRSSHTSDTNLSDHKLAEIARFYFATAANAAKPTPDGKGRTAAAVSGFTRPTQHIRQTSTGLSRFTAPAPECKCRSRTPRSRHPLRWPQKTSQSKAGRRIAFHWTASIRASATSRRWPSPRVFL